MEFLLLAVLLGVAAGAVAQSKGRSFFGYLLLGTFLPIVGLILAIALPSKPAVLKERELETGSRKKCPFCAEPIRAEARVCRFCGRDLVEMGGTPGGVVLRDPWTMSAEPPPRKWRVPIPGERMQLNLGTAIREERRDSAPMVVWAPQDSIVTVIKGDGGWAWVQTEDGLEGWMAL